MILSLGNDEKRKTEKKKIERMMLVVRILCVFGVGSTFTYEESD